MPIRADTSDEQLNTASFLDFRFKSITFGNQIVGVSIKDVRVLGVNVNVLKELIPHIVVIAFGMITRQAYDKTKPTNLYQFICF